jgi:pimeloyl-ACP methyl ester carboxylesterase
VPEWLLGRRHAYAIGQTFLRSATDPSRFPKDVLAIYRDSASRPGALTAMLNWYRAAPKGMAALMRQGVPTIEIPTLMIWGEEDTALGKETTYGTEKYVADLRLHYLPGVSHWVQQDAPERVNELLEPFLRTSAPASASQATSP